MYNHICKKHNFDYIIKLHTKTIKNEYNDLTNFLLSNNLSTLKKNINKNLSNCVGPDNYYLSMNHDIFNKRNVTKYINFFYNLIFFSVYFEFILLFQCW